MIKLLIIESENGHLQDLGLGVLFQPLFLKLIQKHIFHVLSTPPGAFSGKWTNLVLSNLVKDLNSFQH